MSYTFINHFLVDSKIGLFGAGNLGRTIAEGLLAAGFPKSKLCICHHGSEKTSQELAVAGLADLVAPCEVVVQESQILLYLVRPQNLQAIQDYVLRKECLFISFLAGVPLRNLPIHLPVAQRIRIMTSSPDTLLECNGIAALYPADNVLALELLNLLGLRIVNLRQESDIHAFTALGPCLPIVLTYWESVRRDIDDQELLDTAEIFGLPDYQGILQWAHSVRPKELTREEIEHYLAQATTPGGVTEAILTAMKSCKSLSASLKRGIERSRELAAT
jgi:pyrroline-5-carboxylate reductase